MDIKGLKKWSLCCLLLAALLTSSLDVGAQNGINAPYSQYGIGQTSLPYNLPVAAAMGGVVYTRTYNNMINPFNPASYASIGMESFVFDMGLSIQMSTLRNHDDSQYDSDGNLGYLAFGLPLTKWWKTAFGVMPLSDVEYESVSPSTNPLWGEVKTRYEGYGSVTQFFWGHAFNLLGGDDARRSQLRAGFNINYLYGSLTRAITYDFSGRDTTYYMNNRRQKDTRLKNFLLDFGLQYEQPLGDDYRLGAALTLTPGRTMTVRDNALVYTFVTNGITEYMRDTIFPASGIDSEYESSLEQPLTTGIGLSLQRNDRWLVAFDATFAPWSGMKYSENANVSIFGATPLRYDNNYRLALGLQLLGDKNATSYLRRITFSAGGHYEHGKLSLQLDTKDYTLDEWGVGLGASLPMRKGRSVLNLSLSYSSFGTPDLLQRNMITFGLSIGSCESWFVKRKFN